MPESRRFKVVVAEDEELILANTIKKIEACDSRFVVVGAAGDGKCALDLIDQFYPDVLFTDIRMPVMDGLELMRIVSAYHPYIRVAVISGYGDFEYARRAITFGVRRYLLKPLQSDDLRETLDEIGSLLEEDDDLIEGKAERSEGTDVLRSAVEAAERFIRANFRKEIDLEELARVYSLSPSQFCRLFKKYQGDTPVRYLMTLRMNESRRLLANMPDLDVKTIGELVGYPDQFYFSRVFKGATGLCPTDFRASITAGTRSSASSRSGA
jgi:YesN/AraC family two-component response regulator